MPIMSTGPPFSWSRLNRHLKAPRVMTAHGQLGPLPAGGIPESSLHVSVSLVAVGHLPFLFMLPELANTRTSGPP